MSFQSLLNAHNFLTEHKNLYHFVKNFNEVDGFAWSSAPEIDAISNGIENDGHSGASFAFTMRACQRIFKGQSTLDDYKPQLYSNSNPTA